MQQTATSEVKNTLLPFALEGAKAQLLRNLTYFWAFAEGGLGGMLHLLHIPVTGIVVGGFSTIVNIMVARYSGGSARVILQILGVVLMAKFALSPYSPIQAYVAVAFQGLLAAILFPAMGVNRLSASIYAVLVMLESGIQKPLMAWLIFGNELWQGIQQLVQNTFGISESSGNSLVWGGLLLYLTLYALWGLVVAQWAVSFLGRLEGPPPHIEVSSAGISPLSAGKNTPKPKKRPWKTVLMFISLLSISAIALTTNQKNPWMYLLRTFAVLFLLSWVVPFLFRRYQASKRDKINAGLVDEIALQLPRIKNNLLLAYQAAATHKGLGRLREMAFLSLYWSLHPESSPAFHAQMTRKPRRIVIFTRPIQTGKSTQLLDWAKKNHASGFITPTMEGIKHLVCMPEESTHPYQAPENAPNAVAIGKYWLHAEAFEKARASTEAAIANQAGWLVMDEIGRLELQQKGHHALLMDVLNRYSGQLLLVVREGLLAKVLSEFELEGYPVEVCGDLLEIKGDAAQPH